jgi:hypothetical protein
MASDRKQFERAYSRWQELREANELSLPDSEGLTAIVSSNYPFYFKRDGGMGIQTDEVDIEEFEQEAEDIASHLGSLGLASELFIGATAQDMQDILLDREISSVVTIGHGSISDIFLRGAKGGRYDWRDVSADASHLKQGTFTQRQCGIFRRNLNVPLGYFAVSDHKQVRAAVGTFFDPETYTDNPQKVFSVIDDIIPTSYRETVDLFSICSGD